MEISIRLEDPKGAPLPAARPGQWLTLRVQPDTQHRSVLRNYSLSGPPNAGYYRITVKHEHEGAASGYLHTRLRVGAQLEIAAPRGTFILDRPSDLKGRDFDGAGRISASVLAELEPPRDAQAYLFGPAPFMDEINAELAAMGIDASRIHTEPFGPAPAVTPGIAGTPARTPHPPSEQPGGGPTIQFARSNLAIPWSSHYRSLLELAEACDVPVRWTCRTGVCHSCDTTLTAGELDYNPQSRRAAR